MALNARKLPSTGGGPKADPIEPGSYPARLVQVIDLGLQKQRPYKGEDKKPAYELMVTYELVDEFMKDEDGEDLIDKPRWLSETFPFFSLDADRAKSTQRYYALDPEEKEEGNWAELLETPCMVNVIQNQGSGKNAGKVFNNVASITTMRPKEANRLAPLVNPTKYLDLDSEDVETFLSLPQFVQDKIKEGLEFEGTLLARTLKRHKGTDKETNEKEDDVPKDAKKPKREAVVEDDDIPFDEPTETVEEEENW